jgi:hypothetical protein
VGRRLDVASLVQREVEDYAKGDTWNAATFALSDTTRHIYAVLVVPEFPRLSKPGVVVLARVLKDRVVVDEDITDIPLVNKLVRAGIPRDKIVLLYAGERVPADTGKLRDDSV